VEFGESATQESLVSAAVEQAGLEAEGREVVALSLGEALDESVQAQAAQIIAHASGANLRLGDSEQLRKQWPQSTIAKALGLEAEQDQHRQQSLHPLLPEGQSGHMLAVDLGRFLELIKRLGPDVAVVGQLFDLQDASVGGEANLAQAGQILEASAHPEVVGVVDRGFGPQPCALRLAFMVLFEVGVLIVDVQGGHNALGDNARPASAVVGGLSLHLAGKDQLHLFGTAQIDIFADGEGVAYHDNTATNLGSGVLNPANDTYLNEFRIKEGVDSS
jgi:hypothetical protein